MVLFLDQKMPWYLACSCRSRKCLIFPHFFRKENQKYTAFAWEEQQYTSALWAWVMPSPLLSDITNTFRGNLNIMLNILLAHYIEDYIDNMMLCWLDLENGKLEALLKHTCSRDRNWKGSGTMSEGFRRSGAILLKGKDKFLHFVPLSPSKYSWGFEVIYMTLDIFVLTYFPGHQ